MILPLATANENHLGAGGHLKAVDLLMGQLAQQQTNSVLPKLLKFFRQ